MEIRIILKELSGCKETGKSVHIYPELNKKVAIEIVDDGHVSVAYIELFIDELQKALAKIAL